VAGSLNRPHSFCKGRVFARPFFFSISHSEKEINVMYMLYLVSAIAISAGLGVFVVHDKNASILNKSAITEMQIMEAEQEYAMRALRRAAQMNPGMIPNPASGTHAEIPLRTVTTAIPDNGMHMLGAARYFVNDQGAIIAVMERSPVAPTTGNGDQHRGVTASHPQHIDALLQQRFGVGFDRGPDLMLEVMHGSAQIEDQMAEMIALSSRNAGEAVSGGYLAMSNDEFNAKFGDVSSKIGDFAQLGIERAPNEDFTGYSLSAKK